MVGHLPWRDDQPGIIIVTASPMNWAPSQSIADIKIVGKWELREEVVWAAASQLRKFLRVRRGCQASQGKGLTSWEVWGTSGEVWETSGEPRDCWLVPQWENFQGSRRKTSGELRGTSGEVRGLPRSSGEPDSLQATRQICLQTTNRNDKTAKTISTDLHQPRTARDWQWQKLQPSSKSRSAHQTLCRQYVALSSKPDEYNRVTYQIRDFERDAVGRSKGDSAKQPQLIGG